MGLLTFIFLKSKWLIEVGNIFAGILSIAFGVFVLYYFKKYSEKPSLDTALKGFLGGIGLIIVGIMFIIGQISISDL